MRLALLARDPGLDGSQRKAIAALERIVLHASELCRNAMDARREPITRDVQTAIAGAIEIASGPDAGGVRFENTVPVLPAVYGARWEVQRVVVNLLLNACRASPSGTVRVSGRARRGEVEILVEDDGPGISAAVRDRIFARRFTTNGGAGSGLGLTAVKETMDRLGGAVRCSSACGRGASFRLTFRACLESSQRRNDEDGSSDPGDGDGR